jgi:hypothetical protein
MPMMDEKLEKRCFDYKNTDNLLGLRWRDNKDMYVLTSTREPKIMETTKKISNRPELVKTRICSQLQS